MKLLKLLFAILLLASPAGAALTGKLDLGSPPSGFIMRDAYNGQWRGGYSKSLYKVQLNGNDLFYLGYNHTWNVEHGNSAIGLGLGKRITLSQVGSSAVGFLNVETPNMPPFAKYLGNVLSVEGDVAYMPSHSKDVYGPIIGGFGFQVDLSDVFAILSKGL